MAEKSAAGNLVPLIILVLVLGVLAAVGWVAYQIATDVGNTTKKKMEKRNISFTKDGMKVGIKEVSQEQQGDSAQNMIMKIWNQSYSPAYKSRLGWMGDSAASGTGAEKRKPYSRSASSQNNVSKTTAPQSVR